MPRCRSHLARDSFAISAFPATNLTGGDVEPITIPIWNEAKLGPMKTLTKYRAIGETAAFKAWHKNWYRARKIAHGHTAESAEKKVKKAFPDLVYYGRQSCVIRLMR